MDVQIFELNAINSHLKETVCQGETLCIDESMVKSFAKNLKGKMKIIRKPRPIGNEFKTLCDADTKIVLHMELYEGKEYMKNKAYVDQFGATTQPHALD